MLQSPCLDEDDPYGKLFTWVENVVAMVASYHLRTSLHIRNETLKFLRMFDAMHNHDNSVT